MPYPVPGVEPTTLDGPFTDVTEDRTQQSSLRDRTEGDTLVTDTHDDNLSPASKDLDDSIEGAALSNDTESGKDEHAGIDHGHDSEDELADASESASVTSSQLNEWCCDLHERSQGGRVIPDSFVGFAWTEDSNVIELRLPTQYQWGPNGTTPSEWDDLTWANGFQLHATVLNSLQDFDDKLFEESTHPETGATFSPALDKHMKEVTDAWYRSYAEPRSRCDRAAITSARESLEEGFDMRGSRLRRSYIRVAFGSEDFTRKPIKPRSWLDGPSDGEHGEVRGEDEFREPVGEGH